MASLQLLRRIPFRFQLSTAASALVVITVAAMLVPVYLSGRRAMLHATRDDLQSRTLGLSRIVDIEVIDSAAADSGHISVASVTLGRALRQYAPRGHGARHGDLAEYVLLTANGAIRVATSNDSTWRASRSAWTAPAGLADSLARIVAADTSIYFFRAGDTLIAVAPIYRNVSIPAAVAVVRADLQSRSRALLADLARFWWLPASVLLTAVLLALYVARGLSRRLARLASQARAAADGNLDAFGDRQDLRSSDEVAVLHDALARMSGGLRAHLERAEQHARMEAVGRLAASVAHDFNNVLTIISGSADLGVIEARQAGAPTTELEEIRRATQRGAALTRQLLLFSGQRKAEHRYVAVDELLRSVEAMLRRLFGTTIEIAVIPEAGSVVAVDAMQLEQVLVNLAINARDAMPNGGTLLLSTRRATPEEVEGLASGSAEFVALDVTDTGHGIDPSIQARIFEPFFTTKEPGKGTGLGLASAAKLLREMGGTIRVRSALGQGATFTLVLPAVNSHHSTDGALPAVTLIDQNDGGATILVVEDESGVRIMVSRVLRARGYEVLEARHGLDALILLETRGGSVDLVISDVLMPGLNGDALARRLAVTHPHIPVILMSGYPGEGADLGDVLLKPFSADQLLARVRKALARAADPQIASTAR